MIGLKVQKVQKMSIINLTLVFLIMKKYILKKYLIKVLNVKIRYDLINLLIIMECTNCYEIYDENKHIPLNLECGHTYCK